ncbi:MAG: N-acetylmuramic acid 6-phosphate etherase [Betaproteobacteria bacterium]|nr:N-acetylmuramic acid 6-phosphate etherase [Betaproteobacteria bacterium]
MSQLKTESPSDTHTRLDEYSVRQLVDALVGDQIDAVEAARAAREQIALAVDAALPRIEAGGRLIYVGAGTSGRLALLDSVELYPTFSWPKDRAIAVMAGGKTAVYQAIEGAEDNRERGALDIAAVRPGARDVVLLLAASGTTPYVLAAAQKARDLGALTVGIANNPGSPLLTVAEIGITLDTGPELISGSTRLKAGTAQKIALNTFSSALMVKLNKVYGNLMVDLKATNAKLAQRAVRLTMLATGADEALVRGTLKLCDHHVKVAIVALARGIDVAEARARLDAAKGSVRAALAD